MKNTITTIERVSFPLSSRSRVRQRTGYVSRPFPCIFDRLHKSHTRRAMTRTRTCTCIRVSVLYYNKRRGVRNTFETVCVALRPDVPGPVAAIVCLSLSLSHPLRGRGRPQTVYRVSALCRLGPVDVFGLRTYIVFGRPGVWIRFFFRNS